MSWQLDQPFTSLRGTAAVVTGAAGGIGSAVTTALVDLGVTVVAADIDPAGVDSFDDVIPVAADVSTADGIKAIEDAVNRTGKRLSLWLNNAGVISRELAMEASEEEFDRVFGVNVRGTFLGSRAAFSLMSPHGQGAIVNVSSLTATRVQQRRSVYGPSKSGIDSLTRYLGAEWGPSGVRVNAVAPGFVLAPMSIWYRLDETGRADLLQSIPLRQPGQASDIASMVLVLASPLTGYVTGQTFHVDGGWTL